MEPGRPELSRAFQVLRSPSKALAVPKASQNQEAAIEFVKWFTSRENQVVNYGNGVLPTRTSALSELNEAGQLQSGDVLVEESKYVEALFPQGTPTWYPEFSTAVNTAINSAAKGQMTVDEAVASIAAAVEQVAAPALAPHAHGLEAVEHGHQRGGAVDHRGLLVRDAIGHGLGVVILDHRLLTHAAPCPAQAHAAHAG